MKRIIIIFVTLCVSLNLFAQATSLTVDNQTPGWLSSKINYGDQQTLVDLTVTGYVNSTDLEFMGTLMKSHSLKRLNLEFVNIVSSESGNNNYLPKNMFVINWQDECHLEKLSLPISVEKIYQNITVNEVGCLSNYLYIDTLAIGGPSMPTLHHSPYGKNSYGSSLSSRVKCLLLRDGVESLADNCFKGSGELLEKVSLPSTLKSIGKCVFEGCKGISSMDLPDAIEKIDIDAFKGTNWNPDTLYLPKSITEFNVIAFNTPSRVYYYPSCIQYINNTRKFYATNFHEWKYEDLTTYKDVEIHIKAQTPPDVLYGTVNTFNKATIYVPKGAASKYKNTVPWDKANIIEEIFVEGVSIEKDKTLYVGDKIQMSAQITPSDALEQTIYWESNNSDVASISVNGKLEAIGYGATTITATTKDGGFKASCLINVYNHSTGVEMLSSVTIPVGSTYKLDTYTKPMYTSDNKIIFSCDNEELAIVDNQGVVTAKQKGTCTITATTVDGGYTAECIVTVLQPVESVTLEKHNLFMKVGDTESNYVQVNPSNADNKKIIWSSSDERLATVSENGEVKALKPGVVWIKAISEDNAEAKDSCKIIINQQVTGILLGQDSYQLNGIGESFKLNVSVLPSDATNTNVKWTSSNESVCVVSNGTVVAVGEGVCVIIATTEDGGYIATCTVTVTIASSISTARTTGKNPFRIFDVNGVERRALQPGINIIRFDDGTMKKVYVRGN